MQEYIYIYTCFTSTIYRINNKYMCRSTECMMDRRQRPCNYLWLNTRTLEQIINLKFKVKASCHVFVSIYEDLLTPYI